VSYPQPDANKYAANGYDFFRLNTLLASGGDIYESEQSGLALAIGPDSDIANVGINYFDQQVTNFLAELHVSHSRSFVSRVDANNDKVYAPAQRPGRVFIWPDDRWNPSFFPFVDGTYLPASSTQILETPRLDVIQYFTNPPSLVPLRNDKTWFYQTIATPGSGGYAFVTIPYYGRRYAKILFGNQILAHSFDMVVYGVDLQQQKLQGGGGIGDVGQFTPLIPFSAYHGLIDSVQVIVKNGASPTGLGLGGEGYLSFSIATPTGEGITNPRTFTRVRRCVMVDNLRIY
jgi:hypothetical protein